MKILVIGTGYVGLVTGTCFAEMGHHVTCLDIDENKIKNLQNGLIPIYEPGLDELVKRNIRSNRLHFTIDYAEGIKETLVCFIAVSTPSREDGSCNTEYLEAATDQLSQHIDSYKVIVNKSTVPVGSAQLIKERILQNLKNQGSEIVVDVVSNPEFLKEGNAIADCMKPDRIVIGYESEKAKEIMRKIYAPFNVNHSRILFMDLISAEMSKYAANAMLATRISFMNELASLSAQLGGNIHNIRKALGSDERIGNKFLYAGIGYGGSCFPKDIRALIAIAENQGLSPSILHAVEKTNDEQKKLIGKRIIQYFENKSSIRGKTIAIWGLAFKPDTDDMREATSLTLIEALISHGATVRLFDPVSMDNAKRHLPENPSQIIWCDNEFDAATGADAIALVTEWKQFRLVDFKALKKIMTGNVLFDGRNQYNPQEVFNEGFDYLGIGLPELIHQDGKEILQKLLHNEAALSS